jgi:uncharacterized protein (DUF1810 family)
MNTTVLDPELFLQAQEPVLEQVESELKDGRKRTHWMWFIFPQLRGLGHSSMADRYGLAGRDAAQAYLAHPVLGRRLERWTRLVQETGSRSAHDVFGAPDDLKFRSCMTLFEAVAPRADTPFGAALAQLCADARDRRTLQLLGLGNEAAVG